MTQREALAAALQLWDGWSEQPVIDAAARRQLPLEPVECGNCHGQKLNYPYICSACDGRGWTYQPGTVERIGEAIHGEPWADISSKDRPYVVDQAVAVLDALNAEPAEIS